MASALIGGLIAQRLPFGFILVVENLSTRSATSCTSASAAGRWSVVRRHALQRALTVVGGRSGRSFAEGRCPSRLVGGPCSHGDGRRAQRRPRDRQPAAHAWCAPCPTPRRWIGAASCWPVCATRGRRRRPRREALFKPTTVAVGGRRRRPRRGDGAVGLGPALRLYFLEAMMQAGAEMGLLPDQARALGQATFAGRRRWLAMACR